MTSDDIHVFQHTLIQAHICSWIFAQYTNTYMNILHKFFILLSLAAMAYPCLYKTKEEIKKKLGRFWTNILFKFFVLLTRCYLLYIYCVFNLPRFTSAWFLFTDILKWKYYYLFLVLFNLRIFQIIFLFF